MRAGLDLALGRSRAGNDNLVVVSPGGGSSGAPGGARGGRDFEDIVISAAARAPNLPVVIGPFPPVIVTPDPDPGPGDDDDDVPEPPRNRAPRVAGPVLLGNIGICQPFLITVLALLAGASDADADPLSVVNLSVSSGELTAVEGGWEFTPDGRVLRPGDAELRDHDGTVSVAQSASLAVVEFVEFIGTAGDDVLTRHRMCRPDRRARGQRHDRRARRQ